MDEKPDNSEGLFRSAETGDVAARAQLFTHLYQELHRLAQRELRRVGAGLTLSPTMVLHEAYLDMSSREAAAFPDKPRFMAYAARAMRGLIIDYSRNRNALKRGGAFEFTSLPTELPEAIVDTTELEKIGDALESLAAFDAHLAETIDLKFFCGFSLDEIAALQGISERTVRRDWDKARIFLARAMKAQGGLPD